MFVSRRSMFLKTQRIYNLAHVLTAYILEEVKANTDILKQTWADIAKHLEHHINNCGADCILQFQHIATDYCLLTADNMCSLLCEICHKPYLNKRGVVVRNARFIFGFHNHRSYIKRNVIILYKDCSVLILILFFISTLLNTSCLRNCNAFPFLCTINTNWPISGVVAFRIECNVTFTVQRNECILWFTMASKNQICIYNHFHQEVIMIYSVIFGICL